MAKKGTKAYKTEYVRVHYGIHRETLDVRSVWEQRDGGLSGEYGTHYPPPGAPARAEVMLVFDLIEVRTVPIQMVDSSTTHLELKEKADQLRAQRQAGDGQ